MLVQIINQYKFNINLKRKIINDIFTYLKFTDYILEIYLINDAEFPPQICTEFLSSTMRTSNNC